MAISSSIRGSSEYCCTSDDVRSAADSYSTSGKDKKSELEVCKQMGQVEILNLETLFKSW